MTEPVPRCAVCNDKIDIDAQLKPAFALVSTSGQATGLNADLRVTIERAFEAAQSVTLFAPAADQLETALKAQQLTPAWLAFDAAGLDRDARDMTRTISNCVDLEHRADVRRNAAVVMGIGGGAA